MTTCFIGDARVQAEWEAGGAATQPLPMIGGAIPFPAPPLELPRVSAAGAARTAATIAGAAGVAPGVAPGVTRRVDDLFGRGTAGMRETAEGLRTPTTEAVTPEGVRVPVRDELRVDPNQRMARRVEGDAGGVGRVVSGDFHGITPQQVLRHAPSNWIRRPAERGSGAEYGFGDAWGRAGSTSDEVAGGGGGGGMSPETARSLADYERRLQITRDANAARAALTRGDTERAATILSANPEVGIEINGQRLMGEGAASYLTRNARQTAADAGRRLAVQPPDLSNRGVPELSMPPGAPSGQIPLEAVSASASPPPLPSFAGQHVAARQGVDRAAQLRSQLTGQAANLTPNSQFPADYFLERLGPPPLPPGMLPDAEQATRWGVRQVIDTRGIDSQSRDLGRQVARQGLLQLGWSSEQGERT